MTYRHLLTSTGAAALVALTTALPAQAVVFHAGSGAIQGSLCVGFDCPNSPSFDDATILLMENNTRIKFGDTSSINNFPQTDWELEANSQSNGGPNRFSIFDCGTNSNSGGCSGGSNVFSVTAGAGSNALFVDSAGRVGFGTGTPVVELHVRDGDTPTLRLEQDNSSGFDPQTWDVAGNETNFFIRDATGGSTLPLRIRPGAPTSSIDVASDGEVGLGTSSPGADLHVLDSGSAFSANADTVALFQSNGAAGDAARITILAGNAGVGQLAFGDADNEFAGRIRYFHSDNHMDFLVNGTVEALRVFDGTGANVLTTATSAAVLTSAGVWQDASSRTLKQNIHALSAAAAMETLQRLEPVTFNYIKEPGETTVGFIAEDVPDLVATESRRTLSSLDIVAVLTRVVQEQQDTIATLHARLERLEGASAH